MGVLACGALTFGGSTAQADSTNVTGGRVYMAPVTLSTDTYVDIPVHYDLPNIPYGYSWTLELDTNTCASGYAYGDGPDFGDTTVSWCAADLPGKFAITGLLKILDEDYNPYATDLVFLDFTVRKMTTKATIRAGRKAPKVGQSFSLKGCVTAHGKRQDYRDIVYEWKKAAKGAWKKAGVGNTDGVGCYNQDVYHENPGNRWWRIRVPGDSISKTGYSKAVKVNAHR